jgi:hypothetical protein
LTRPLQGRFNLNSFTWSPCLAIGTPHITFIAFLNYNC